MDKKSRLTERFRKFIDSLSKEDTIAVLHHTDPDGVCSGVIMAELVEIKRGKKVDFHINQEPSEIEVVEKTRKFLAEHGVNKLIITDLGVDQFPEAIKEIEKFAEILVMDHHKIYNDIESKRTVFIKPQLVSEKKPAAYSASKLCFDFASELIDVSNLDWIAAVGLIGDAAAVSWRDFLDAVFMKYDIEKKNDVFETKIGRTATIISNAECFDSSNAAKAFEIVYNASSPKDVLDSELKKCLDIVESEIEYWLEYMEEFAESDKDFIFYLIKPKYGVKAPISTKLAFAYPDKTIIIVQDMGKDLLGISARRADEKIAVNELLEKSTKELEGARAGGHITAAGGRIRKEDFGKFKENLFRLLNKNG